MYSTNKTIRTISLIGAIVFALTTARAVDPPPDGGYPNANTAEGEDALFSLTTGADNTAIAFNALFGDEVGDSNTAVGSHALAANAFGSLNTAIGYYALADNNLGGSSTGTGWFALQHNTEGIGNTATGATALGNNTTGDANTAVGWYSLFNNFTGIRNTAIGVESLIRNNGSNNIAIGYEAGQNIGTGSNNICIGHIGVTSDTNMIRIGKNGVQTTTIIAGINGATVPDGVGVVVGSHGQLGTIVSSAAFKDDVKPMDKASEAILALQPVTFHYKPELDPDGIPQFGLVAEQVAKVYPDLVARDEAGKPFTVRYDEVNAMLLNEFLKEHRKVEALEATVARQQRDFESQIATLDTVLKEQTTQIQKVSDQLKTRSPAPRVVANN
jgi:uncharacterized coiled-coil protein SlyX